MNDTLRPPTSVPDPDAALANLLTSMPQLVERVETARRILRELDDALHGLLDGSYVASPMRECLRCGHRWQAKSGIFPPKTCPKCSSTGWNSPPNLPHHRRPGDQAGAANRRRLEGMGHRRERNQAKTPFVPRVAPKIAPLSTPAEPVPPEEFIGTRPPLPPGMRAATTLIETEDMGLGDDVPEGGDAQ